jgi:hypothetical protein
MGDLERSADAKPCALKGFFSGNIHAVKKDRPRIGQHVAAQLVDNRRLACAIRADEGMDIISAHVKGEIIGRLDGTK